MTNFAGKLNSLYRTLRGVRRDRESFELLFSRFRQVLDDNNRALEIITDMGDTLGGDYLFDIQYVRTILCRPARRRGRIPPRF